MITVALLLEYDGTDFHGWQHQPRMRTVQGTLTDSLKRFIGITDFVAGSGRTDVGVHAKGQVAHFAVESLPFDVQIIPEIFTRRLPLDLKILDARIPVGADFHSRFSATERTYHYTISLDDSVFKRRYSWTNLPKLSVETLQEAAKMFIGIQDFSTFTKHNTVVTDHRCIVTESFWNYNEATNQLVYTIKANRFLYSMVRALVGAMVRCAEGKMTLSELTDRFHKKNRTFIQKLAPSSGLCLAKVSYPPNYRLW